MTPKAAILPLMVAAVPPLAAQNLSFSEPSGVQIGWASEAFATNLRADGRSFEEAGEEIRFELGAFHDGFDPSSAAPGQWRDQWVPLQTAVYDPADRQVIATATLGGNDDPFVAGGRMWVWAYDTLEVEESPEWLLVSPTGWHWPDVSSPLPETFSLSGGLPGDAVIGELNGPGFHLRLGHIAAVPEPAVLLLCPFGFLALAVRRRVR